MPSSSAGGRAARAASPTSPAREELADPARRDAVRRAAPGARRSRGVRRSVEVAAPSRPEAEALPRDDDPRPERPRMRVDELLGLEARELRRELDDEDVVRARAPPSSSRRRSNVVRSCDLVAEHRARMGLERDDRRAQARRLRGVDHGAVAAVHAVERADRDRALGGLGVLRRAEDVHAITVSGRTVPAARPRHADERSRVDERDGALERLGRSSGLPVRDERRLRGRELGRGRWATAASGGEDASSSASSTRERPDRRAPKRRAVAAERVGDRADVRPARDVQVEHELGRLEARRSRARGSVERRVRHLDRDAAAVEAVGALAVDLHRATRPGSASSTSPRRASISARSGISVCLELLPLGVARRRCGRRGGSSSGSACRARRGSGRAASSGRAGRRGARSRTGRACPRGPALSP